MNQFFNRFRAFLKVLVPYSGVCAFQLRVLVNFFLLKPGAPYLGSSLTGRYFSVSKLPLSPEFLGPRFAFFAFFAQWREQSPSNLARRGPGNPYFT